VNIIQFKFKNRNMENVIWGGVPAQRKRKEEKYTTAVVTMSALEKVGAGRKFSFNKAAQTVLGIEGENKVSFGFTPDGQHIYIRKAVGDAGFQLTKTCTISDKRTFEFIANRLKLDTTVENDFDVVAVDGQDYFELVWKEATLEFTTMHVGEISDEADLSADLSSLPQVPEGGVTYEEIHAVIASLDVDAEHDVNDVADHVEDLQTEDDFDFDTVELTEQQVEDSFGDSEESEEDEW
jgi:hypothetical protein